MRCDYCHADHGEASPETATRRVEQKILTLHDSEEGTDLLNTTPVL